MIRPRGPACDLPSRPRSPTTGGCINYGDTVQYVLPRSRIVVRLTSKYNDYGFPVEPHGFPGRH